MSLQSAMLPLQPEMLQQQRGMEKSSKLGMLQLLARLQALRGITQGHRRYTRSFAGLRMGAAAAGTFRAAFNSMSAAGQDSALRP